MNIIQLLSITLPYIALLCVLLIAVVNVYLAIRKHYPVKVNCWFCNCYTQVNYEERNSFYCSACQQYNGFNEDGDYNKLIPEQHDEMLNTIVPVRQMSRKSSNRLCRICNNNQQLKIHQLAAFVPLNENVYDIEIQHFKSLLEKAYKLCPKCEQVLHHTLSEQNKHLIAQRILSMHKKSMAFLNINKSSKHATAQEKKVFFNFILYSTLILISTLLLSESIQNNNLTELNTKRFLPEYAHPIFSGVTKHLETISRVNRYYFESVNKIHEVQEICSFINSTLSPVKLMIKDKLNMNLTHNEYVEFMMENIIFYRVQESFYEIVLALCGVFLQLCTFLLGKHNVCTTILWIFLFFIPYFPLDPYIVAISKVFLLITILYKVIKNRRLKVISTCKTLITDDESSANLSNISGLSASTNYFDLSSPSNNSFQDLKVFEKSTTRKGPSCVRRNCLPKSEFGSKGVLSNPLLKLPNYNSFDDSIKTADKAKSFRRTEVDANDLQNALMHLSLGQKSPSLRTDIFGTRSVLSPPNFVYSSRKHQISWCTDKWLKQEAPFSSRSSQTSGFVSNTPNDLLNTSLPDSASSSICGDFDRSSIISEAISLTSANVTSSVFCTQPRLDLNSSTASNFSTFMRTRRSTNRNTIGLFKPIVFNSSGQATSKSDLFLS